MHDGKKNQRRVTYWFVYLTTVYSEKNTVLGI